VEARVETWLVGGRKATNRSGAAEYLGLAHNTVSVYSSPAGRRVHGWPDPLDERVGRQEVFALADLDVFAASRLNRTPAEAVIGHPDDLVGVKDIAALRGVEYNTVKRYVEDSLNAWQQGEDGYLPRPDEIVSARRGSTYRWRSARIAAWVFPVARRAGGRRPGRRPQPADLVQVLREAGHPRPTVRELAAMLSERLCVEVSSQTVRRLLRRVAADG
jgi:hypothetical protein